MAAKTKTTCGVDHARLRRLQTGVYEDERGESLHFCLDEICAEAGLPPTPENLDACEEALRDVMRERWPNVPVIVATDAPSDQRGPADKVH